MPKLYTKQGDRGKTQLVGGQKVEKFHPRINAYGSVDELNSFLGLLLSELSNLNNNNYNNEIELLIQVQSQLFNLGSLLACEDPDILKNLPKIDTKLVSLLESQMDIHSESLSKLNNFILPGGQRASSLAHVCRSVCRRSERQIIEFFNESHFQEEIIPIINRLSDYLFSLARYINFCENTPDVLWIPDRK